MPNSRWMGKVNRLTASVAIAALAAIAAAPITLAATPTPSPPLSTVLVAPVGSYTEERTSQQDGPMTADSYAGTDSLVLAELHRDGYIQGYVRTWLSTDSKKGFIEDVIAFPGRRDAASWLNTYKTSSLGQGMLRPLTADGVDSFYGGHYADTSKPLYADVGVFLKGNDFFTVSALSAADDLGDTATTQARRQFDAAPQYSISPSQWPENARKSSVNLSSAALPLAIGGGVVLVLLLLGGLAVVLVVTRGRSAPAPALMPAAADGPLMSQDGRYWWDGQGWRDAEKEIPPGAMRSADGYYWWDSRSWRPLPPAS